MVSEPSENAKGFSLVNFLLPFIQQQERTLQLVSESSHSQTVEQGAELGASRQGLVAAEVGNALDNVVDEMDHTVGGVHVTLFTVDVRPLNDVSLQKRKANR